MKKLFCAIGEAILVVVVFHSIAMTYPTIPVLLFSVTCSLIIVICRLIQAIEATEQQKPRIPQAILRGKP